MNQTQLGEYDYILILDGSSSMGERDMPGGKSRWSYMQEQVLGFAREIGEIDSDGIGVVLFIKGQMIVQDGVNAETIKALFDKYPQPGGSTPMAQAVVEALKLAGKSDKKDYILAFTDGVPDSEAALEQVLVDKANSQTNDEDCTIQFVQVGYDKHATAYLQRLDNDLKTKHDIVDTKTMEEAEKFSSVSELILAGIAG